MTCKPLIFGTSPEIIIENMNVLPGLLYLVIQGFKHFSKKNEILKLQTCNQKSYVVQKCKSLGNKKNCYFLIFLVSLLKTYCASRFYTGRGGGTSWSVLFFSLYIPLSLYVTGLHILYCYLCVVKIIDLE